MTVRQAEPRHGGEDPDDGDWVPRHGHLSPRERFTGRVPMPAPVSPAVPPSGPPIPPPAVPRAGPPPVPPAMPPAAPRVVPPTTPRTVRATARPIRPDDPRWGAPGRPVPPAAPSTDFRPPPLPVEVPPERHFLATFGWTAAWYTVPVAIFAAWSLTFPTDPGTACARPTGGACPSPRAAALANLINGMPRVGVALGIALLVAGLIRWGSTAWRPITVGFSSAIIGAGAATVLYSVLSSTG